MALDHLEFQAGIMVVGIPRQQRQPRQYTHCQRHPHARISQHAPSLRQHQQRDEADTDHADEAVVAERTDQQAQAQFDRGRRIDAAQQACTGIEAQHRSQCHRHIGHGQQAQRGRQRHQQGQAARLPAGHVAEPARGDTRDQQRQQCADGQERQTQCQHVLAADFHAHARQPRGQSRQVGVRRRQVLAFLPIERLVHEQGQTRGHEQLGRCDQRP